MVRHLVAEAQRLHPGAITFHYEHALEGVDLASRRLRLARRPFSSAAGGPEAGGGGAAAQQQQSVEVGYDLLLGADGAGSLVRAEMAQQLPGVRVQPLPSPSSGAKYRTFHGIAATPAFADWATCSLQLEQPLQVKAAAEDGSWPGKVAWALKADIGGRPARPTALLLFRAAAGECRPLWYTTPIPLRAAATTPPTAPHAEGVGTPAGMVYTNPDGTLNGNVSMLAGGWDKVGGHWAGTPAAPSVAQ